MWIGLSQRLKIIIIKKRLPTSIEIAGGSDSKESAWNAGDEVQSLVGEDPLKEEMATHSSLFAWGAFHGQRSQVG